MIDIHTHIGRIFSGKKPLTAGILVKAMDKYGIRKAVVLPIENPEETHWYFTTEQVLKRCSKYPDRLIPFCNVDPRRGNNSEMTDFEGLIREYVEKGCKGFGEVLANLPFNDSRMKKIYSVCQKFHLPVLFHLGGVPKRSRIGLVDKLGLPFMEEILKEFPNTIFIAHGPGWWAEISGNITARDRETYPKGKIKKEGKVQYLLEKYPNIYADLSAGSGYNALTRDPEYGRKFLIKFHKKLLFGTDFLCVGQKLPIIDYIKKVEIPYSMKEYILKKNAERILQEK